MMDDLSWHFKEGALSEKLTILIVLVLVHAVKRGLAIPKLNCSQKEMGRAMLSSCG